MTFAPNPVLADIAPGEALILDPYECESRAPDMNCRTIFAYSTWVYDPFGHRMLIFGGGHAATGRTDVDAFDLTTLTWASLYPTMTCEEVQEADITPEGYHRKSGHPVARHSYEQTVIGDIDGAPHLMLFSTEGFGGRCHGYNVNIRSVAALPLTGELVWKHSREQEMPWGFSRPSVYDPISGLVICTGMRTWYAYDPSAEEVVYTSPAPTAKTASTMTYVPPLDLMYYIDRFTMAVYEVTHHRDEQRLSWEALETSGTPPDQMRNIAYDQRHGTLCGIVDSTLFEFHPASRHWTATAIPQPVGRVLAHVIDYDPGNDVFVFVNDNRRVCVYRHHDGAPVVVDPSPPPPDPDPDPGLEDPSPEAGIVLELLDELAVLRSGLDNIEAVIDSRFKAD
jgi:hypothetical protein